MGLPRSTYYDTWPTGATGPRGRPAPDYERFLKRQLSFPVSMISQ